MRKNLPILVGLALLVLVLACRKGGGACLATATVIPVIPPVP